MARVPGVYEGEPELDAARRAFPEAQRLLAAEPERRVAEVLDVGWFSTSTEPETGAVAVVSETSGLTDLFGEVLRVLEPGSGRYIYVYVLGERDVPAPLAVTRRAFLALGLLSYESLSCVVDIVS